MNVLDENILFSQRYQLQKKKVHFRQVGIEIGYKGMQDRDDIIPLLHSLKNQPSFLAITVSIIRRFVIRGIA